MGTPVLRRELAEEAVARVEAQLRVGCVPRNHGGGRSAVLAAAERAIAEGWVKTASGFESRLRAAKDHYNLEPDDSFYQAARYQQPVAKFQLVPAAAPNLRSVEPRGEIRRHLFIPDEHNDPRHPHRLKVQTWVARYGSEHRHHTVIKAGDSGTFDSVSCTTRTTPFEVD